MTVLNVNGKVIDLDKAVPLKVRDFKQLKKIGIALDKMHEDIDIQTAMLLYVSRKCNDAVTEDDIEGLTKSQMVEFLNAVSSAIREAPESSPLTVPVIDIGSV